MKESRTERYSRNLAIWIDYTISTIPNTERQGYKKKFKEELKKYSTTPRKKGQPRNDGCVYELKDIPDCDIRNPEHLARLVKETLHLMYQKQTTERIVKSLLENL